VVPRTLPPVAMRGRPLRDLYFSPNLGISQFCREELVEKRRCDEYFVRRKLGESVVQVRSRETMMFLGYRTANKGSADE